MKKIISFIILVIFLGININPAHALAPKVIEKQLTIKYNRLLKTKNGKNRIIIDIQNNGKKYSKDTKIVELLENMKSTYGVATECKIGSYLENGKCIEMKSSDTQAYQITAQQKTENIVTSIINQSTEKIINTSDTGKTKAQQIQELEDAIASAKKAYQASLDVIQSSKDLITKLQGYNKQYQGEIDYIKTDYQFYIDKANKDKENALQQLNVQYARLGIITNNTTEYDAIRTNYDKIINDLQHEMNNNIAVYQRYIDNNLQRITETEKIIQDRTTGATNLLNSIQASEQTLAKLKL